MNVIDNISSEIIKSLEKNNIDSYKHYREELIIRVVNQDCFHLEDIKNHFIVGNALALILDDMYKTSPILYKRVVLCAVYCLLYTIINDKYDEKECTPIAAALLYILFSENRDFIGGEYLMSKLRNNAEAAVHQLVGMQCVFYWKYKLCNQNIILSTRIEQRLVNAILPVTSKIPDEDTRRKVLDFESHNFSSLLDCIPVDIEISYHGLFIDSLDDNISMRVKSMFKPNSLNFLCREEVKQDNKYDSKKNMDMRYSSEVLNSLSYLEWMETIAKELNAAGFKGDGFSEEAGRFMRNISPYEVHDVRYFFMGAINDAKAMDYLKSIGLVNNGRCPMCGAVIKGTPSSFTSGTNKDLNFHICTSCRKQGQRESINPANNLGCMLAIALIPWHFVKNILANWF